MRGMEVTGSSGGTLCPWDFLSGREEGRKTRESVGRRLCEKEKQGEWTYFLAPPTPWGISGPAPLPHLLGCQPGPPA